MIEVGAIVLHRCFHGLQRGLRVFQRGFFLLERCVRIGERASEHIGIIPGRRLSRLSSTLRRRPDLSLSLRTSPRQLLAQGSPRLMLGSQLAINVLVYLLQDRKLVLPLRQRALQPRYLRLQRAHLRWRLIGKCGMQQEAPPAHRRTQLRRRRLLRLWLERVHERLVLCTGEELSYPWILEQVDSGLVKRREPRCQTRKKCGELILPALELRVVQRAFQLRAELEQVA